MTAGQMVGPVNDEPLAPADDTGRDRRPPAGRPDDHLRARARACSSATARTASAFAGRKPAALRELPPLPADELDPELRGGDLCVQACSDDPQVAFHAVRDLARIGRGAVVMRWSQLGFGRTSTTSRSQSTPRNLMGFKDGTNNIRAEDTDGHDGASSGSASAIGPAGCGAAPTWSPAGSGCCSRSGTAPRFATRSGRSVAASTRARRSGPSTSSTGRQLDAREDGHRVIPVDAHIRLAAPAENAGQRILRRGYSFTDGVARTLGELDAGLFFICFQRDPERQFVPSSGASAPSMPSTSTSSTLAARSSRSRRVPGRRLRRRGTVPLLSRAEAVQPPGPHSSSAGADSRPSNSTSEASSSSSKRSLSSRSAAATWPGAHSSSFATPALVSCA